MVQEKLAVAFRCHGAEHSGSEFIRRVSRFVWTG